MQCEMIRKVKRSVVLVLVLFIALVASAVEPGIKEIITSHKMMADEDGERQCTLHLGIGPVVVYVCTPDSYFG